jgi:hypothetical protein
MYAIRSPRDIVAHPGAAATSAATSAGGAAASRATGGASGGGASEGEASGREATARAVASGVAERGVHESASAASVRRRAGFIEAAEYGPIAYRPWGTTRAARRRAVP